METKDLKAKANWGPAIIRIVLGLILLPHGAQKLLGLFGGYGFKGTMDFFTGTKGLPWIIGFLVIIIEFFGSISLILGFGTKIWSALVVILLCGIIFTSHVQNGFFMNWFGNQKGEGYEYFLLAMGMAASLVFTGGGNVSLDNRVFKNSKSNPK